jgi:hypothetical protein
MAETVGWALGKALNDTCPDSGDSCTEHAPGYWPLIWAELGYAGQPYSPLLECSPSFSQACENMFVMAQQAVTLAQSQYGKSVVIDGIINTHGESDIGNTSYEADLVQWQSDFDGMNFNFACTALNTPFGCCTNAGAGTCTQGLRSISGQSTHIPMFLDQVDTWGEAAPAIPAAGTPVLAQYDVAALYPGKFYLVAPKYQLPYQADSSHITGVAEDTLGRLYAKAIKAVSIDGGSYPPFAPGSVVVSGSGANTILTVTMNVLVPPLVLDTATLPNYPDGNYGLRYADNSSPPTITSVTTSGTTQLIVHLSGSITATAGNRHLQNAIEDPGAPCPYCVGPTGPHSNIRDSDIPDPNWSVTFDYAF